MVAYCKNCDRLVNQFCDRCGDNFGITICEKYACGGTMRCPNCNGAELTPRKEFGPDPYDFKHRKAEEGDAPKEAPKPVPDYVGKLDGSQAAPQPQVESDDRIKICPYCGKKLDFPEVPQFCPYCEKQILH